MNCLSSGSETVVEGILKYIFLPILKIQRKFRDPFIKVSFDYREQKPAIRCLIIKKYLIFAIDNNKNMTNVFK